jgi:putative membrane protein
MMSLADHDRIHAAIAEAERRTSGEIFCVVAKESGHYREVAFAWAAGVALLAPPLALVVGLKPSVFLTAVQVVLENGWMASHMSGRSAEVATALVGYAAVQIMLFVIVLTAVSFAPVRRALTPGPLKQAQVHANAMEQFAHRLHATRADTGILIFASLAERRVEIIADEAIHAKVPPGTWDRAIGAALAPLRRGDATAGLIATIEICGAVLAEHYPSDTATGPSAGDVVEI